MFEYWDREPTNDETSALIEKAAKAIRRRKMETPAIFAIELHKPLANTGAHAAMFFAPFLVPFFGMEGVGQYSAVFRKRENLERLMDLLAAPPEAPLPSESRLPETDVSPKES
jgi:hypothetical protein